MNILGIIPARGGSKRLKNKNILPLMGKPMILYTLEHARQSRLIDRIVCTTDSSRIARVMKNGSCEMIRRPKNLARDRSRLEDAIVHAVRHMEREHDYIADIVVILLPNIPVRADGVIDRTIEKLVRTGADSVFTVEPVGKNHPCWMVKVGKDDRMAHYEPSPIFRGQDLPPLYINNGAAWAVWRSVLFGKGKKLTNYTSFGDDLRLIVQKRYEAVDVDDIYDFKMAEIVLKTGKRNLGIGHHERKRGK